MIANALSVIPMMSQLMAKQCLGQSRYFLSSVSGQHLYPGSRVASAFQNDFGRRRIYPCTLSRNSSCSTRSHGEINSDADDEAMARQNALSRRLYRILLRTCKQGVELANKGNCIDYSLNNDDWILLQPPLDKKTYGFAKIVEARRGNFAGKRTISLPDLNYNEATRKMKTENVGMAMEVLRFVHISLGGDADDDLEEYYLGIFNKAGEIDGDDVDDYQVESAAAGRHSQGHYTQFLDKDEEREEEDSTTKPPESNQNEDESVADVDWDSDGTVDENLESDESVLVTVKDLQNAVRLAFRAPLHSTSQAKEEVQPISTIIGLRHRDAINACSLLTEQISLWGNKSSISIDWEHGVRVVATSSLMMEPLSDTKRYRFMYRIRVENISDIIESKEKKTGHSSDDDACNSPRLEHRAVQLLGRTWIISERSSQDKSSSSVLQRLLEKGTTENNSVDEGQGGSSQWRVVQTVNEPKTGAGN